MKSMTGCGSGTVERDGWEVTAELKTVNHRFLDISMRLPRNIAFLEQPMRQQISAALKRGHVDVYLTVKATEQGQTQMTADLDLARQYCETAKEISALTGAANDMTVSRLMRMDGVITLSESEMDEEEVTALCAEATETALNHLVAMRTEEGKHLERDLAEHLENAEQMRERILQRAPNVVSEYREKLEARLKAMKQDDIEPQRVAQEVALIADRCAIDEELARLNSHILQMRKYLRADGENGKKMDFLIQEMNRETNTIGSKASDAEIAQIVVDLKSEIEKLREQIQNVE